MAQFALALTFVTLLAKGVTAQHSPAKAPQWVPEQGASVAQRDDTIELNGSRGWIRLDSVFSDFVLEFDFQLPTKSSSGSVSIRSRPGYDRTDFPFSGYHLLLSNAEDFGRVQMRGVTSIHSNDGVKPAVRPVGEWQHARIEARARILRVTLNDAPPLTSEELDEFAGYVALRAERGRVAFRNLHITRIPPHEEQFQSGILRESAPGVRSPKLVREVKPFYPKEPHDAWIQGKVMLEAVVQEDGSVGDVRVTEPKHADLDQAAVAAVRKWQFAPAQKNGHTIPLIVSVEMTFTRTR